MSWRRVIFYGVILTAYIPPADLWIILAKELRPSDRHTLAQIADDGPYRWLLEAT